MQWERESASQSSQNEPVERTIAESSRDRQKAFRFDPLPFQFQVRWTPKFRQPAKVDPAP